MDLKQEFEKNLDHIISDLKGLIEIPSVAVDTDGQYPFGEDVQRALEYMLNLGQSMGFAVKNVDNYGGHIDFQGSEQGMMAIVGHIDVVPASEEWTYEPFQGTVVDDWMYGRGMQDDKGPTMIGLYAMKILKDLGFQPKKTIRLILGLDEEASWNGMKYYLSHEKAPDFGIVPDADFPLIQCERGLLQLDLVKSNETDSKRINHAKVTLEKLSGGSAPNVVAGNATIQISGDEHNLKETETRILKLAGEKGYEIGTTLGKDNLIVTTVGKTAHAAYPERGRNAISMAIDLLDATTFQNVAANELIKLYRDCIHFTMDGSKIGCKLEDLLSGNLTFNVGKIDFDDKESRITVDIRYPVTKSKEVILEGINQRISSYGFKIEEIDHIQAIYQEAENPVVKTLLEVYREISGDLVSQPSVIGGATFARAIPNCMAFGPLFPGDPELEHQKDEGAQLSQLIKAGIIYAEAILRLAK